MLGKCPWEALRITVLLGTYRNLRQVVIFSRRISTLRTQGAFRLPFGELLSGKPECELVGKAPAIARERFVEAAGRNTIKSRKIRVHHYAMAANHDDQRLDDASVVNHRDTTIQVKKG